MTEQMALSLLVLVHTDEHPPEAWGDWYTRGSRLELCRTCSAHRTRGRYCDIEPEFGVERSEAMCPACWVKLTHVNIGPARPASRPA